MLACPRYEPFRSAFPRENSVGVVKPPSFPCGVVVALALFNSPPSPPLWCGVVWSGVVVGCVRISASRPFPLPVLWWWVLGLRFRACTRARPVVWVVGLFRV